MSFKDAFFTYICILYDPDTKEKEKNISSIILLFYQVKNLFFRLLLYFI
jgi:hypothetical protein